MRKALVEKATGKVVNVIVLAEGANYQPPEGCDVVSAEGVRVAIGDRWNGTKFVAYVPTAEEVAKAEQDAADEAIITYELLVSGRWARTYWGSLTTNQRWDVLKGLLTYVLRREGV